MPNARKPGVDWNEVCREYVASEGKGVRALGRKYGVHHSTILERAEKHNWLAQTGGEDVVGNAPASLPATRQRFYEAPEVLDPHGNSKKTPARIEAICQEIAAGASEATASVLNDIDPKTWGRWKAEDEAIQSAFVRAFAVQGRRDETTVDKEAATNANTALKRLSKNPLTKDHWADAQHGPSSFTFNLNIPLPGTIAPPNGYAQGAEPITIEHEPTA